MTTDTSVLRYSVRVSASDDCDCRATYEALYVLCRVPESRREAKDAANELAALLAADGYNEFVSVRIDAYRAVLA